MSQHSALAHRFHETHGNDIMIYHNWTTARRTETKDNGLVFTSKPIKPFQKIRIKLVEVSDKHPGIINIGFTNLDPSSLRYDLPKSTKSELKRKTGFWIGSLSKHMCVKDRVLFFYVSPSGTIHYGVDGVEKGRLEKKVDTSGELWGLMDIWSPTTTIQLICPEPSKVSMLHDFSSRNMKVDESGVHKRYKRRKMSYVFTSRPLNINQRVLIKIVDGGTLCLGVTSCDPALLKHRHLPDNPDTLLDRPEYWVVINDPTWDFQKNDELSYIITGNGEMKIWRNSALLLKVVHVDHTLKLWGFFGLGTLKDVEIKISSSADVPVVVPSAPMAEREKDQSIPASNPAATATDHSTENSEQSKAASSQNAVSGATPSQNVVKGSDCVICYEGVVEAALYPCGHMCMCFVCAKKQWRNGGDGHCPICRARIRDVMKVYKS